MVYKLLVVTIVLRMSLVPSKKYSKWAGHVKLSMQFLLLMLILMVIDMLRTTLVIDIQLVIPKVVFQRTKLSR